MAAVIGFLVVGSVAVALALLAAGPRHAVRRDETFELVDVSSRFVPILGALAGFAVTAIVFLVTQARNVPDPDGTPFTTVLAMFVVAYMGYFSSSLLYANVSHRTDDASFDLAAAQYAGASISLFAVLIGWFALKPLFETFGLQTIATLTGWLLIGAVVVAFSQLATALDRSGYASVRLVARVGLIALVGVVGYAVVIGTFAPELRSPSSALQLTVLTFLAGVPAYVAMAVLPMAARRPTLVPILADRWHLAVIGYAQAALVLVGFILLAILGLA